jgi:Arc/MetJ-type ribon-helix-helix transcriptional regulator
LFITDVERGGGTRNRRGRFNNRSHFLRAIIQPLRRRNLKRFTSVKTLGRKRPSTGGLKEKLSLTSCPWKHNSDLPEKNNKRLEKVTKEKLIYGTASGAYTSKYL